MYRNTVITAWSLLAQKPPERLNGKQDKINQSRCKHKAIYSSFIHFPQNWTAAMDSRLIFAGGRNLGSNNRSGLVGWTRGLLGNAFNQQKGRLMGGGRGAGGCFRSTHLPLLSSLSLKGTIYKKVHWLCTESPHKHWNINPFFFLFTGSVSTFIFSPLFWVHLGSVWTPQEDGKRKKQKLHNR